MGCSLDTLAKAFNRKRFAAYVPRDDIDLPNYTPEQLDKQCDLEIIKVFTARCAKTEGERGKNAVYYRRTTTL